MFVIAFALTYAGLTALSLAMNRHARDVLQRELPNAQRLALRILGGGLLNASLFLAAAHTGLPAGVLEWFGMVTASGLVVVLFLTYLPKVAIALAIGLPALAGTATLLL